MALTSTLFRGDARIEEASRLHPRHIKLGEKGSAVGKIQKALKALDGAKIAESEINNQYYGPSTAKAVFAYKQKRSIINTLYQRTADDIVGIMTVAAIDREWRDTIDRRIDPSEIMGPPMIEPIPGSDIVAPDGFIAPVPRRVRSPGGKSVGLENATVNIFKQGEGYVVVIDNLNVEPHPNARTAAKGAANGAAKRATNSALRRAPDPARRALGFGAGRIAGGLVSVAASVIDPSPIGKELHWTSDIRGKRVHYVALITED